MDSEPLHQYLNQVVRLTFADGEMVEGRLLGLDAERSRDLTYEVLHILREGRPRPKGTTVGATCIARLDELVRWEQV